MARKRKKKRSSASASVPLANQATETGETRAADAATVFWMLTVMATLLAEVTMLIATALLRMGQENPLLYALREVLLLIAVISGVLSLVTIPMVLKSRRVPPPMPVMIVAVVIGLLPVVTLLIKGMTAAGE